MTQTAQFQKDVLIVRELQRDPWASAETISSNTDIPVSTIRKRLTRLKEDKGLRYRMSLAGLSVYLITIDVDPQITDAKGRYDSQESFVRYLRRAVLDDPAYKEFTARINVESVGIVLGGNADIALIASCETSEQMCAFVTRCIRRLDGVKGTNTSQFHECY